jgi:hypothetical protein
MRQLTGKYHRTPNNISEISALEWAIPILEKYLRDLFGEGLPFRTSWHKHEKMEIYARLWDRDGNICYLCEKELDYKTVTLDHVIPLSKNGKDRMDNYKLVHEYCNLQKGNMLLEDYRNTKAGAL